MLTQHLIVVDRMFFIPWLVPVEILLSMKAQILVDVVAIQDCVVGTCEPAQSPWRSSGGHHLLPILQMNANGADSVIGSWTDCELVPFAFRI